MTGTFLSSTADYVVVGAGFAGLWSAYRLAASGVSVSVISAPPVGGVAIASEAGAGQGIPWHDDAFRWMRHGNVINDLEALPGANRFVQSRELMAAATYSRRILARFANIPGSGITVDANVELYRNDFTTNEEWPLRLRRLFGAEIIETNPVTVSGGPDEPSADPVCRTRGAVALVANVEGPRWLGYLREQLIVRGVRFHQATVTREHLEQMVGQGKQVIVAVNGNRASLSTDPVLVGESDVDNIGQTFTVELPEDLFNLVAGRLGGSRSAGPYVVVPHRHSNVLAFGATHEGSLRSSGRRGELAPSPERHQDLVAWFRTFLAQPINHQFRDIPPSLFDHMLQVGKVIPRVAVRSSHPGIPMVRSDLHLKGIVFVDGLSSVGGTVHPAYGDMAVRRLERLQHGLDGSHVPRSFELPGIPSGSVFDQRAPEAARYVGSFHV